MCKGKLIIRKNRYIKKIVNEKIQTHKDEWGYVAYFKVRKLEKLGLHQTKDIRLQRKSLRLLGGILDFVEEPLKKLDKKQKIKYAELLIKETRTEFGDENSITHAAERLYIVAGGSARKAHDISYQAGQENLKKWNNLTKKTIDKYRKEFCVFAYIDAKHIENPLSAIYDSKARYSYTTFENVKDIINQVSDELNQYQKKQFMKILSYESKKEMGEESALHVTSKYYFKPTPRVHVSGIIVF